MDTVLEEFEDVVGTVSGSEVRRRPVTAEELWRWVNRTLLTLPKEVYRSAVLPPVGEAPANGAWDLMYEIARPPHAPLPEHGGDPRHMLRQVKRWCEDEMDRQASESAGTEAGGDEHPSRSRPVAFHEVNPTELDRLVERYIRRKVRAGADLKRITRDNVVAGLRSEGYRVSTGGVSNTDAWKKFASHKRAHGPAGGGSGAAFGEAVEPREWERDNNGDE